MVSKVNSRGLTNAYGLIDGDQMAKDHPETWSQPSLEDRKKVVEGDYVKIGITTTRHKTERPWVIVKEKDADGSMTCIIANDLVFTDEHGMLNGDRIRIEYKNIIGLYDEKEVNTRLVSAFADGTLLNEKEARAILAKVNEAAAFLAKIEASRVTNEAPPVKKQKKEVAPEPEKKSTDG